MNAFLSGAHFGVWVKHETKAGRTGAFLLVFTTLLERSQDSENKLEAWKAQKGFGSRLEAPDT